MPVKFISKSRRYTEKMENSFWERELKANNTRRKSLEHLNYITIPFETLPMSVMTDDESVLEYQQSQWKRQILKSAVFRQYGPPHIVFPPNAVKCRQELCSFGRTPFI